MKCAPSLLVCVFSVLAAFAPSVAAQNPKVTAKIPRASDGKPDLTGVWQGGSNRIGAWEEANANGGQGTGGMADNGNASTTLTTRRAYDLLAEGFGRGFNGPFVLGIELDDGATVDALVPLRDAIAADPGVQSVSPATPNADGTAAIMQVISRNAPQARETTDLVHRLRDDVIPAAIADHPGVHVHVGGRTAFFVDLSDKVTSRIAWFIGAVLLLSVLLLMMVFRSIAVPLKAAAMNLLSIGAAYGVVVEGRGSYGITSVWQMDVDVPTGAEFHDWDPVYLPMVVKNELLRMP